VKKSCSSQCQGIEPKRALDGSVPESHEHPSLKHLPTQHYLLKSLALNRLWW